MIINVKKMLLNILYHMYIAHHIKKGDRMFKVFKPSLYQGNKRLKKYFEGWYFKQVTADEKKVFSFIPGISLNPNDPHSFIQFIDGITGFSRYVRYDHKSFQYSNKKFEVRVGNSFFSSHKMILDINEED